MDTTRSGSPSCQPLGNSGGGGRSAASPSGAPWSTQRWMSSSWCSPRARSPTNEPRSRGAGCQGGMKRLAVTIPTCLARLATSR